MSRPCDHWSESHTSDVDLVSKIAKSITPLEGPNLPDIGPAEVLQGLSELRHFLLLPVWLKARSENLGTKMLELLRFGGLSYDRIKNEV